MSLNITNGNTVSLLRKSDKAMYEVKKLKDKDPTFTLMFASDMNT